jgi:hypothetical protein
MARQPGEWLTTGSAVTRQMAARHEQQDTGIKELR